MASIQTSLRVLVIEDETASRLAIVRALRDSQHTVFEAADGVAGLEIAKTEPLDAVVLDLMLPRMDGIRLLTELRRTSRVPVIVVSARRTEDDRVEALDLGADD
jgi:DNA-binding response OmpR family regulator